MLENEPKDLEAAKAANCPASPRHRACGRRESRFPSFRHHHPESEQVIGSYIHMGGKISVAVLVEGGDQDFANQLAMHIAANSRSTSNSKTFRR
jgi:translation elongation factor EF-Ts